MKTERVQILKDIASQDGTVLYWMSRDQRAEDNWALVFTQELAHKHQQSFAVVFCISTNFAGVAKRHYEFMIAGLKEVAASLKQKNIPFYLLLGDPLEVLDEMIIQFKVRHVVTDFDPLRNKRKWKTDLLHKTDAAFYEVDAHNIVPCWAVSQKVEFGAYTIRPKIKKLLPFFLDEFPEISIQKNSGVFKMQETDWLPALNFPEAGQSVSCVTWLKPGARAAQEVLNMFINQKLRSYNEKRNDPNEDISSNISPYLNFGQIGAQRIALEIIKNLKGDVNTDSFLEELIIRRELSDNFCFYNSAYDSFGGFPEWARKSLDEHRRDEREYLYDSDDFESAQTHDPLWNAAQSEMVKTGKMHGYMRMYWAKKILEWTKSPEEALEICILLNDRYQLDGRDPNGYTGCAWSIGGVHDRAWADRPVFGKIRFMNYSGCKRKFNVDKYIQKWI